MIASRRKKINNKYLLQWGKVIFYPWWKEPNVINLLPAGWLIPQVATAAYQSVSVGHCWQHDEDSAVVMVVDKVLIAKAMLHPCHHGYLLISTVSKHWAKEADWHLQLSDLIHLITIIPGTVGTFPCAINVGFNVGQFWDFHSHNSSPHLATNLHSFPFTISE